MDEPTQQQLAADLEAEWIHLFDILKRGAEAPEPLLCESVPTLLVEIETLLFLHPHEQRALGRAWLRAQSKQYNAALVAVHPLIHRRAGKPSVAIITAA